MLVILEALVQQGESKNCYSNAEDYNIIIVLSLGFCNLQHHLPMLLIYIPHQKCKSQ